ncbi:MAG: hypothetical protein HYY18_07775 [Planctomycetes bacterium]|nr:hypothetical protein [Planctomycetota bacterium]
MTAREWKALYARERDELGEKGLLALLEEAPAIALPDSGAIVFPHTRLRGSGTLPAAAAAAVVNSGRESVVALGVLHGGAESDAARVRAAREGDPEARRQLRRVHGPGAQGDAGVWEEEFSLDGFKALLELAANRAGRRAPRVLERYPFLAGANPADLPGLEELTGCLASGAALVATADPIHYGVGYGTAPAELRPLEDPATHLAATASIMEGLDHLAAGRLPEFLRQCESAKSDFRDPGAALSALLGPGLCVRLHDLRLVDYADVLACPRPTWVAGALFTLSNEKP